MPEVDMKTIIKILYKNRYNMSHVGTMLGINRKTVRKVLKEAAQGKEKIQEKQNKAWPSMLDESKDL